MPEPSDLLRVWQDALRQVRDTASAVSGPGGDLAKALLAPLERQAQLLESALERQIRFERELAERVLEPVTELLTVVQQGAAGMRAQAEAFDAAAASFNQAADMLKLQAAVIERLTNTMREPGEFLGDVIRTTTGERAKPKPAAAKKKPKKTS